MVLCICIIYLITYNYFWSSDILVNLSLVSLTAGIKKINLSVLCYCASSSLGFLAGFLLDVEKHKLFFTLSKPERYVDFTQNSEYILKTNFLYIKALLSSW